MVTDVDTTTASGRLGSGASSTDAGLAAALVAAFVELGDVPKNQDGQWGKFADLAAVHAISRAVLGRHGLAVVQDVTNPDGQVSVITEIVHRSGESRRFGPVTFQAPPDPQKQGSAISYARRYGLMAALGIAARDDDDGQTASDAVAEKVLEVRRQMGVVRPASDGQRRTLADWRHRLEALPECDTKRAAGDAWRRVAGRAGVVMVNEHQASQLLDALEELEPDVVAMEFTEAEDWTP